MLIDNRPEVLSKVPDFDGNGSQRVITPLMAQVCSHITQYHKSNKLCHTVTKNNQ